MKKIFVDTNILVDLIADRKPFSKFAIQIFSKAEERKIRLYTSSHSIATTHYLLKKYIDEKELRDVLNSILDYLNVVAIDIDIIKKGLKSKYKDFEDALQIISAYSIVKIDCIVTRNAKDFKGSEIPVLTPDELIKYL
ncbi:MAG: type II toxin-antitoxin system VapC family toxin [Bacteroidota bacterium]|jgi:predicted nucleic acid-binding protein